MRSREMPVEELLAFEAGLRRRRRVMLGVVVALGVGAAGVFAYAAGSTTRSDAGVPVTDYADLSPDERAEVARELERHGYAAPADFTCPAGQLPISGTAYVASFCVDARDATNAEVAACIASGKCATPQPGLDCAPVAAAPPDEPATCIDAPVMEAYCKSVGRRIIGFEQLDRAVHVLPERNIFLRCVTFP